MTAGGKIQKYKMKEAFSNLQRLDERIADLNILRNEIMEYQKRIRSKIVK